MYVIQQLDYEGAFFVGVAESMESALRGLADHYGIPEISPGKVRHTEDGGALVTLSRHSEYEIEKVEVWT